ncbi:hypothetical protein CVT26_006553 [Gymnopilus dilepis]|uniref:DUF6534 domain-containing protein n=1 Tax=Gymnopilus dilepis TaxID=231916 RepID=A0A409W600_9AGAR|nr:hypothetical protein CVT26_006553 [Gymnopilus dilepis]
MLKYHSLGTGYDSGTRVFCIPNLGVYVPGPSIVQNTTPTDRIACTSRWAAMAIIRLAWLLTVHGLTNFQIPFLSFQLAGHVGFPIGHFPFYWFPVHALILGLALIPRTTNDICPYVFKAAVGETLLTATLSTGAALDVLTCLALTGLLWKEYMHRSKVLRSSVAYASTTTAMLSRLILLSLNTGMWTAILAVFLSIMIHISATGNTQPLLGFYHLLSPLYFFTVLINLNVRGYIRSTANKRGFSNVQFSNHLRSILGPDLNEIPGLATLSGTHHTSSRATALDRPLDLFGPPHSEVDFL